MTRDGDHGDRLPLDEALRALARPTTPPGTLEDRIVERLADTGALSAGGDRGAGASPNQQPKAMRARSSTAAQSEARARGFRRSAWVRAAAAALAGVALFSAGVLAGGRNESALADGPRYALLLLPGPRFVEGDAAAEAARVTAYAAWAGRLASADRLVLAEKLGETVGTVEAAGPIAPGPAPTDALLGFFIIIADSDAAAIAAARESPHAAAGGRVAVIRIDPT